MLYGLMSSRQWVLLHHRYWHVMLPPGGAALHGDSCTGSWKMTREQCWPSHLVRMIAWPRTCSNLSPWVHGQGNLLLCQGQYAPHMLARAYARSSCRVRVWSRRVRSRFFLPARVIGARPYVRPLSISWASLARPKLLQL